MHRYIRGGSKKGYTKICTTSVGRLIEIYCDALLQDGNGQRLSTGALRTRFDKARKEAGVSFQFRDIQAKTATDTEDLAIAQKLLGHKTRAMTEHYTRNRKGEKVSPLK